MRIHDENASFRFNQKGLRKFLGDLECEIMELVWDKADPTITVRDVFNILRLKRDIAYTTVMTTMVRLAEKGLLKIVDKSGLANLYSPVEGREQFIRNSVNWVLDIFFEEFPEESATYLAEATRRRFEKKPTKKR